MEDSYTVHRRRKAAARKREKTPEPPRRRQDDVTETDDEEDARARMERMVRETEMLEQALEETERKRFESEKSSDNMEKANVIDDRPQRALKRALSPEVRRPDAEIRENVEKFDNESSAEVSTRDRKKKSGAETKSISGKVDVKPEVTNKEKDLVDELTKGSKRDDKAAEKTSQATVKHRRDAGQDLSPETRKRSAIIGKNEPREIEKMEQKTSDDRANRSDDGKSESGNSMSLRKTSSRKADEVERAALFDENRREARETNAEASRSAGGKILKKDSAERRERRNRDKEEEVGGAKIRETMEKSSILPEDKGRSEDSMPSAKIRSSDVRPSTKRSSKDRNTERTGYTTDSSETEETVKRSLRRKKSPEVSRSRGTSGKKMSSRSRPTTDTDGDPDEQDQKRRIERKSNARRRLSSETDEDIGRKDRTRSPAHKLEKTKIDGKKSARYSTDTNEEDSKTIKKSESFPPDKIVHDRTSSASKSTSDIKKQIIPLSDDSLIEDFERAQLSYLRKERSIFDHDPLDDYVDPKMEAALRRRKFSIIQTETKENLEHVQQSEKRSWFSWLPFFGKKRNKEKLEDENETKGIKGDTLENDREEVSLKAEKKDKLEKETLIPKDETKMTKKHKFLQFFRTLGDFALEFRAFVDQNPRETRKIRILKNRCLAELLLVIIYCGLGAFVFRFTEGAFETFYKCGVKRVKRDFLDSLWNFSHSMREEDWKSMARRKLMEFEEQLHTAHEAGVHSYSGQKSWSFLNAVVYCLTVITTIGYGHISPSTTTGRAITIVYAIFGIPMFLIILADFGKLFTRGIKFLWAFVRRVYYTGSCRRVRRTVPVQEVMKGVQLVYDLATFRRPSQMNPEEIIEEMEKQQNQTQTVLNLDGNAPSSGQPGTPGTPAMSTFAIDDEFNLPISVAIVILLAYIFVGATVYNFWEQWGFFESFYFVFISMSTIGFGDYVPKHPIYMMLSIVYLVFGLALTSMCINVVQVMLSDSFKQASQKIGATIGFEVAEEDGSVHLAVPQPVEMADVHETIKESDSEEQVAPKAKQEDIEL